jgi:hypothetical protein
LFDVVVARAAGEDSEVSMPLAMEGALILLESGGKREQEGQRETKRKEGGREMGWGEREIRL